MKTSKKRNFQFSLSGMFVIATVLCVLLARWHYMNRPRMELRIRLDQGLSAELHRDLATIDGVASIELVDSKLAIEIRQFGKLDDVLFTLRHHGVDVSSFNITQNAAMMSQMAKEKKPLETHW